MIGRTNALSIIGGAGGGDLEIELPSEFATATNVYYFKVNDNKYLISADITDIGIWEYSTSTGTVAQKYNFGDSWNVFYQDGDGVFISHSSALKDGCLYYKTSTGNFTLSISEDSGVFQSIKIDNKTYLYSSNTSNISYIYIFDEQTKLATKVNGSLSAGWSVSNFNGDWIFWGTSSANSTRSYIQKLDTTNNELTTLYSGFCASKCVVVNGGALFFGASTDSKGILFYDNSTKTVTLGYSTGVWSLNYDNYSASETKVFWCGTTITNYEAGTLMFDVATKTFTKIENTSNRRVPFAVGDNCLFGGQSSSDSGINLYKNSTGEITKKYTSSYNWKYFHKIGNVVLISSSSSGTGILLYNISGETATKVYSSGYYFNGFEDVGEDCLIYSSQQALGVLLYYSSALTITQKFSSGRFDLATKDGNNTYLENSNKATYAGKVLYDASDGSVKLAKWKIS